MRLAALRSVVMASCLFMAACTDIPKEAPQLSYTIGQDIAAMQASHRTLTQTLFKELKQRRIDYVDNVWTPLFVKKFVANGRLKDIAAGTTVWDDAQQKFLAPSQNSAEAETQLVNSVVFWGDAAVKQIAKKKQDLLQPLDEKEQQLLSEIDQGYARILAANAQVTALLTTLSDVQEMNDQLLSSIGLGDLREKIVSDLSNISNWANASLTKVREADAKVLNLKKAIGDL